jgi:hypothetical protein
MATRLDADEPEVRAAADSARTILERLGAKPLLARLEAALARPSSAAIPESTQLRDPSRV